MIHYYRNRHLAASIIATEKTLELSIFIIYLLGKLSLNPHTFICALWGLLGYILKDTTPSTLIKQKHCQVTPNSDPSSMTQLGALPPAIGEMLLHSLIFLLTASFFTLEHTVTTLKEWIRR